MQKDKKKSCKCRQKIIIKNNSTSECTTDVILSRVRVANMKLHISLPLCCHFVATSFAPGLEFHSSQPISGLSELNKLFACFESLPFAFGRSAFAQELSKIISAGRGTDVQEGYRRCVLETRKPWRRETKDGSC